MAEINFVPYIDVMLVLLVIFLIASPFVLQGIVIDLPDADAEPLEVRQLDMPLVLSINTRGEIFVTLGHETAIEAAPLYLPELAARIGGILRMRPNVPILVRGDTGVSYGQVLSLLATVRELGAHSVNLVTEPWTFEQ